MLLSQDSDNNITVAAKHMPGDYDIEYTSPWAGANYLPYVTHLVLQYENSFIDIDVFRVGQEDHKIGQWEKATWPHLQELAQNCPEAGIHFQGNFAGLYHHSPMAYTSIQTPYATIARKTKIQRRANGLQS